MQSVLSRLASLAVVAAGILVAAILLLMTASARAVVPEEHAASAPSDGPLTNDPRAIPTQDLKAPGAARGGEFAPGEVIVKFNENVAPGERANVRSQVGLKKQKDLSLIKAEVDKVEGRSVEDATRALERRPELSMPSRTSPIIRQVTPTSRALVSCGASTTQARTAGPRTLT